MAERPIKWFVTGTLLDQALLSLNDHLVHTKPLFLTRSYNQQWSGTHSIHTLYLNLWTFISFLSDSTFVIQHNWQVRKSNLVKYPLLSRKNNWLLTTYSTFVWSGSPFWGKKRPQVKLYFRISLQLYFLLCFSMCPCRQQIFWLFIKH